MPAIVGGAFGLLGGYLTDRFGRRRVLVWSILLYAFSAMGAGFATSIEMLLVLRSTTYIGVFVEFVAAVAWIAELFPDPKQREAALGYTQAFSSIGGLMVTARLRHRRHLRRQLPGHPRRHAPWRYTLISGVIPALPLILIRPFLPESPAWQREEGGRHAEAAVSVAALFTPELRRTTIVTTILFACAYGAAFGAIQQMPRIVPGLPEVRALPVPQQQQTASLVQAFQEVGGLVGRFALAFLAHPHRLAPEAAARLPGARAHRRAAGVLLRRHDQPRAREVGHVLRRASLPWRSSRSGGTTCRASIRRTCAAPAKGLPPTSAAACSGRASPS